MARLKNSEVEEREAWVLEQFRNDPTVSAPQMNKLIKAHFKHTMRAKRVYELRDIILAELGWTKDDRGQPQPKKKTVQHVQPELNVPPLPAATTNQNITQANRTGGEQLFSAWVVPVEGMADGTSFGRKLQALAKAGGPDLKIDSMTDRYVVVTRS